MPATEAEGWVPVPTEVRFVVEKAYVGGFAETAHVIDGADPIEVIAESVIDGLATDLQLTIGGVTMFLAAWRDPEHWATDWATKLGVESDDAPEAVAAIIAAAEGDGS